MRSLLKNKAPYHIAESKDNIPLNFVEGEIKTLDEANKAAKALYDKRKAEGTIYDIVVVGCDGTWVLWFTDDPTS